LHEISKSTPVCALLPFSCIKKFKKFAIRKKIEISDLVTFCHEAPLLANLQKALGTEPFPDSFFPLLNSLIAKAEAPFLEAGPKSENPDPELATNFFPALPEVRRRGRFVADGKKVKVI